MRVPVPGSSPAPARHPRWLPVCLALALLSGASTTGAREPLLTVLKNTLLGGATGLVLGGAASLVVEDSDRADAVRWCVAAGTFGGFALGVVLAVRGEEYLFGDREPAPEGEGGSRACSASPAGAGGWLRLCADEEASRAPAGPPRGWLADDVAGARAGAGRWHLVLWRWKEPPERQGR